MYTIVADNGITFGLFLTSKGALEFIEKNCQEYPALGVSQIHSRFELIEQVKYDPKLLDK